ncbi:hypothetical protein BC829DRAFT_406051 [Chytridium lagenaria]|nr:hypothetical protein BC829DRAFT_406051 [Chytridium lagenaria]
MGNDNNLDPQARMQLWRDSTKNDTVSPTGPPGDEKHQMSMDILAKNWGYTPRPPPPHLAGQGDFEPQSRRMLLEDEIMSQFMSKGQQASNGVSKEFGSGATNSMGGGGGRRLTEKEIIQTQILQSLSGGGAAPISNVTPLVAAPPGTRVMTEEEFLRMQRGGQPVSNTSPTTGGQTRQSPPSGAGNINPMGLPPQLQGMSGGRMYLEEDVHMGKNGPPMNGGLGRGMPPNFGMRGERDLQGMMPPGGMMGGGPPMGGNAEMSRVMAMLQRSTMGNSMDMQGGLPPQNHQRMNPMHPNMPFPPMGPGPMGMGAPRPGFMFPPHLQNLPPHLIGPMMGGPPGMPQPPGGSLYRNAVNANFGGSEDPVAALLQSSINAKKGGMMFGGPPGPGMMGRPPMMDSPMGQPSFPQGPPGMQPFFPQQMMNPNQPGGPPMGYGMPNVGKPNNFY